MVAIEIVEDNFVAWPLGGRRGSRMLASIALVLPRCQSRSWLLHRAADFGHHRGDLALETFEPGNGGFERSRLINKRLLMPRAAKNARDRVIVVVGDRVELVVVAARHRPA